MEKAITFEWIFIQGWKAFFFFLKRAELERSRGYILEKEQKTRKCIQLNLIYFLWKWHVFYYIICPHLQKVNIDFKKSYLRSVCFSSEKRFSHSEFIDTIQVVKPLKFNQYWKSLTKFKNYWNYAIFSKCYKWSNYLFGIVLSLLWSIAWRGQPISED
jgi:hypothetical protein